MKLASELCPRGAKRDNQNPETLKPENLLNP